MPSYEYVIRGKKLGSAPRKLIKTPMGYRRIFYKKSRAQRNLLRLKKLGFKASVVKRKI